MLILKINSRQPQYNFAAGLITAPPHYLRRMKSHQEKLRENPVSASGAAHEKAQLFSSKTHCSPMIQMRVFRLSLPKQENLIITAVWQSIRGMV
nr:hypothetical protein [uncultured Dyadobacter sp.]